jgi:hypothetical protein
MCDAANQFDMQIEDAQHDIESIEGHIDGQDGHSISIEQIRLLRQLQNMYRVRITFYKINAYKAGLFA